MRRAWATLAFCVLSSSGSGWDGPLFPVQQGRIILPLECERAQPGWDAAASYLYGLGAGDSVSVLSPNGAQEARLGELSCFIGECQGNYASIPLESPEAIEAEAFAAVDPSFLGGITLTPATREPADEKEEECSELFENISVEPFPEIESRRSCESVRLDDGERIVVARKWFMQENGWPIATAWARAVTETGSSEPLQLDYDTNPLRPRLLLEDRDGTARVLWSKSSGICCPSAMTLRMSRVDESGNLVLGRAFTAGGQPCD